MKLQLPIVVVLACMGCVDSAAPAGAGLDVLPDSGLDADGVGAVDADCVGAVDADAGADAGPGLDALDVPAVDTGPPAHRLHIALDYSFDTKGFFNEPKRRAAWRAAADTWSELLADDFDEVPAGTTVLVRNPQQPEQPSKKFQLTAPIDDLRIYVGCSDTGGKLGKAYSAFVWNSSPTGLALKERYQGEDYEPWTAAIGFHCDRPWFFDATPATSDDIPKGSNDFISTARHEIGHCLGALGSAAGKAWVDFDKALFKGPAAMAAFGGVAPLEADGRHIKNGTLSGGAECVMDPTDKKGERKHPTPLDQGILVDVGYVLR